VVAQPTIARRYNPASASVAASTATTTRNRFVCDPASSTPKIFGTSKSSSFKFKDESELTTMDSTTATIREFDDAQQVVQLRTETSGTRSGSVAALMSEEGCCRWGCVREVPIGGVARPDLSSRSGEARKLCARERRRGRKWESRGRTGTPLVAQRAVTPLGCNSSPPRRCTGLAACASARGTWARTAHSFAWPFAWRSMRRMRSSGDAASLPRFVSDAIASCFSGGCIASAQMAPVSAAFTDSRTPRGGRGAARTKVRCRPPSKIVEGHMPHGRRAVQHRLRLHPHVFSRKALQRYRGGAEGTGAMRHRCSPSRSSAS
jgi:hypothetical protein